MSKNQSSGGVGFFGLLTVAFVVLKLTKVINWSWWWVLLPTWLPIFVLFVLGLICILIYVIRKFPKIFRK